MSGFRLNLEPLHKAFADLGAWSFSNKWIVFAVSLVILSGSLFLSNQVRMDNSFEAFFDANDEAYSAYKVYRNNFGSDEIIYLMYDASEYSHGIFNVELMDKIHNLTKTIDLQVPFVHRVRSISNAELMIGREDELVIKKISEEWPLNQQGLLDFAEGFKKKPLFLGNLFDKDFKYGAIVVEMTQSSTDPADKIRLDPEGGDGLDNMYPQVSHAALKEVLAQPPYNEIPFYISGDVPLNSTYNEIVEEETATLGGASMIIILVILALFFRGKIIGIVGPLVVVGFAMVMTIAFISLMGWNVDMMFVMAPTLLLAIGVAHSVHIVSAFLTKARELGDRKQALSETLYLVGTPCLLTSLTTAAGFFAMSTAPIKSISHMAIYMSMGVLFAFFLSVTLLTFFLNFIRIPEGKIETNKKPQLLDKFLRKVGNITIAHPKKLIGLFVLIVFGVGTGIADIKIDSNYLHDFSNRVQVKLDTQYIDNTMSGMGSYAYLLDTKQEGGIKDPEFLKELDRLQQQVDSHYPLVRKTTSIVDLLKDLNQSFHADNPEYYRIPESRELVAQYLLVYEMSGGEDLFSFITDDYSQALIEMRMKLTNSSELAEFDQSIQSYLETNPLTLSERSSTGIGALWMQLMDYISDSQRSGVLIALGVITLLISFIFGSFKLGVISMIPNIAPIVIVTGAMGWFEIYLDYTKLFIAPIAIGIAVDDTIHMITRFRLEFQRLGNYKAAFEATIQEVGRALVITSVTLVCGFCALFISVMSAQVWFGVLLSSTIILALLADLFIMPILVFWLKPFGPEREVELSADGKTDEAMVAAS